MIRAYIVSTLEPTRIRAADAVVVFDAAEESSARDLLETRLARGEAVNFRTLLTGGEAEAFLAAAEAYTDSLWALSTYAPPPPSPLFALLGDLDLVFC